MTKRKASMNEMTSEESGHYERFVGKWGNITRHCGEKITSFCLEKIHQRSYWKSDGPIRTTAYSDDFGNDCEDLALPGTVRIGLQPRSSPAIGILRERDNMEFSPSRLIERWGSEGIPTHVVNMKGHSQPVRRENHRLNPLFRFRKRAQFEPAIGITANNQNRVPHSETAADCQTLGRSSNYGWRRHEWKDVDKESDEGRNNFSGRYSKGTNESSQTNKEGRKENANVEATTEFTR